MGISRRSRYCDRPFFWKGDALLWFFRSPSLSNWPILQEVAAFAVQEEFRGDLKLAVASQARDLGSLVKLSSVFG